MRGSSRGVGRGVRVLLRQQGSSTLSRACQRGRPASRASCFEGLEAGSAEATWSLLTHAWNTVLERDKELGQEVGTGDGCANRYREGAWRRTFRPSHETAELQVISIRQIVSSPRGRRPARQGLVHVAVP